MENRYDYILVGGGPTTVWAAQNIRANDDAGTILLIADEPHPPYDRPPLSKSFLIDDSSKPDDAYTKYDDFYPKNRVELRTATRVTALDRAAQTVTIADGKVYQYGKLLLATGARPKALSVPGADRTGVFLLRHIEDSEAIRQALQASRKLVVVGAGYIGMEAAAAARERGLEVTVVEPKGHPWSRFADAKLGGFLQRYYEGKGVQFLFNEEVTAFESDTAEGIVKTVVTKSGQRLPADCVVVGIGVTLNTELAKEAGLEVDPAEGVLVDEYLQTSDPNIWAAGDIACFTDVAMQKRRHIEHHLNAKWQGQAVGKVMAGVKEPYDQVPYFFSDEFDIHMILRGDPQASTTTLFSGDVDGAEFIQYGCNEEGVLKCGVAFSHEEKLLDPISDKLEALIRAKVNLKGREAEIQAPGFDIQTLN